MERDIFGCIDGDIQDVQVHENLRQEPVNSGPERLRPLCLGHENTWQTNGNFHLADVDHRPCMTSWQLVQSNK